MQVGINVNQTTALVYMFIQAITSELPPVDTEQQHRNKTKEE